MPSVSNRPVRRAQGSHVNLASGGAARCSALARQARGAEAGFNVHPGGSQANARLVSPLDPLDWDANVVCEHPALANPERVEFAGGAVQLHFVDFAQLAIGCQDGCAGSYIDLLAAKALALPDGD